MKQRILKEYRNYDEYWKINKHLKKRMKRRVKLIQNGRTRPPLEKILIGINNNKTKWAYSPPLGYRLLLSVEKNPVE